MKLQLLRNGNTNSCPSSTIDPNTQTLIDAKDRKGWDSFCLGAVDSSWMDAQDVFLRSVKRRTTDARWISKLTRQVCVVLFKMWDRRNHILHSTNGGLHRNQLEAICNALREDFVIGNVDVPSKMNILFAVDYLPF